MLYCGVRKAIFQVDGVMDCLSPPGVRHIGLVKDGSDDGVDLID